MFSVFDIDQLQSLLRDFYRIAHIRITVFDDRMRELVSWPPEVAPCCAVIRETPAGAAACVACDRQACADALSRREEVHIYRCHAGLTEAVAPLYVGNLIAGYLLFGHVFSYSTPEEGWRVIAPACAPLGADMDRLEQAVRQAVPVSEETIRSAAHILQAVASYLILHRMASLRSDPLTAELDAWVSAHFTEKLTADSLCSVFHIGKTQLYRLSRQLWGCGVSEHIRALRMEHAKDLLMEHPEYTVADVCERCGFEDYNYFIAAFTRQTGLPPKKWRAAIQSGGTP